MKLKREQFKTILKECIKELAEEGVFNKIINENLQSSSYNRPASNDLVNTDANTDSNPYNFNTAVGNSNPQERLSQLAKLTAEHASGNDAKKASMLAGIFEDTARTTLQSRLAHEGRGGGQMLMGEGVSDEQIQKETAELEALSQGRGVNHWAKLALGHYNKK